MMFHTAALVTVLSHVELVGVAKLAIDMKARVEFQGQGELVIFKNSKENPNLSKSLRLLYSSIRGVIHPDNTIELNVVLERGNTVYSWWRREQSSHTSPVVYKIERRQGHNTYFDEMNNEFEISNRGDIKGKYDNRTRSGYFSNNEFEVSNGPYVNQDGKKTQLTIREGNSSDIEGMKTEFIFETTFSEFKYSW